MTIVQIVYRNQKERQRTVMNNQIRTILNNVRKKLNKYA
jgi:CHASE1-domain containing sensor protein